MEHKIPYEIQLLETQLQQQTRTESKPISSYIKTFEGYSMLYLYGQSPLSIRMLPVGKVIILIIFKVF